MRTCVINLKTGFVENVVELGVQPVDDRTPPRYEEHVEAPGGFQFVASDAASIGWTFYGGVFTSPVQEAVPDVEPSQEPTLADIIEVLSSDPSVKARLDAVVVAKKQRG